MVGPEHRAGDRPGPLMVPLLTKYSGTLGQRFGLGATATFGCVLFGVGLSWWILRLNAADHDYLTGLLLGVLLTGVGVRFAMPALCICGHIDLVASWD